MSLTTYLLRNIRHSTIFTSKPTHLIVRYHSSDEKSNKTISPRMAEFKKKLEESPDPVEKPPNREITPIKKLDQKTLQHPKQFQYPAFPNNTNPVTGEINGPKGPEPTRYGDFERKGRCSDF